MLGLGMSVGTPKDGITAPVVFVPSFEALDAMTPEQVKGKIVVFNPGWHGYGVNTAVPDAWRVEGGGEGRCGDAGAVGDWAGDADSAYWLAALRREGSRRFLRLRSRWKMR